MSSSDVVVRPIEPGDHDAWVPLFVGYRTFYEIADDPAAVERVWSWIQDPDHGVNAHVAELEGELVGFAHHRIYPRPSEGETGLHLDDLFTAPSVRGRGVGRALIARLTEVAGAQGAAKVRWITAADNVTAQRLYDDVAQRTSWVTYDLPL